VKAVGALWQGLAVFLFGASVTLLPMVPLTSYADDPMCVFVSQKGTAWVVRKDLSVKVSLKVGDLLFPGDQVIVMHGNTVHLAFDKDLQNVIQVEGESLLQLTGSNPINVELYKGKVFAVINKKTASSQFRISTPAAIASVRGTQYEVTHSEEAGSKVYTYEGRVEVAGRDASGKETKDTVIVHAGEKTSVKKSGEMPLPAKPMTASEKNQVVGMLDKMNVAKSNYAQTPSPEKETSMKAIAVANNKILEAVTAANKAKEAKAAESKKLKSSSSTATEAKGSKVIL
jgi:hypothetical protein